MIVPLFCRVITFPLYYEIKTVFVLYLVLPFTQGSSIIYRKIVHPQLSNKEKEIDQYIERAAESSCSALMHFGAKGLTYVANTAIHTAIKIEENIVKRLIKRTGRAVTVIVLQLSSDRSRFILVPLDNVTELTEEESQNAESFNVIESGDISRAEHHRKSTSDAEGIKLPKPHVYYLRSNTEPLNTYTSRANLKPAAQSPSVATTRCPAPISPHSVVRAVRRVPQSPATRSVSAAAKTCTRLLHCIMANAPPTLPRVQHVLFCDLDIILHKVYKPDRKPEATRADLSTAPRWRRESVGRPEKTQVVWPASLSQSHLHEKPHLSSCLSANLLVRPWVCPLLHLYHPSVQLHSSSQHPITPSSPTPPQSACKDTDSLWKGWKASCDNGIYGNEGAASGTFHSNHQAMLAH
ncbi:Receptor expression-enhancing protein 2 [Taenia solium]|eukprot:TsM_000723100 transcript=TsM_000723100 gene=TsM_000723100